MEKPCILATTLGAPGGIYKCFEPCIEKHFTIIPYERFVQRKEDFAAKIQALFVWGAALKVDQSLLQSLPNLKAVVNGGVGVDHLDIPLINSFGVKVSNTPHVVDNATADIGMSLMLASARKIVEGKMCSFLLYGYLIPGLSYCSLSPLWYSFSLQGTIFPSSGNLMIFQSLPWALM